MDNKKVPKNSKLFHCELCNFTSSRLSQLERHNLTAKHIKNKNTINIQQKSSACNYVCSCGKIYLHRASLYNHKKKCNLILEDENNDSKITSDLVLKLINENNTIKDTLLRENVELQKQIKKQSEQITDLIPKVGNFNNNNIRQKFNVNVFLNEKCKDAINMNEFVKSLEISIDQLDFTKSKGLVSGLSNAILENMNKLDVYKRPLHCTDLKRETIYIKDDNIWEKDNSREKIKNAIKDVSNKQYQALQKWIEENPDYKDDERKQEYFAKTISVIGKDDENKDEKIIKYLCSNTYLPNK